MADRRRLLGRNRRLLSPGTPPGAVVHRAGTACRSGGAARFSSASSFHCWSSPRRLRLLIRRPAWTDPPTSSAVLAERSAASLPLALLRYRTGCHPPGAPLSELVAELSDHQQRRPELLDVWGLPATVRSVPFLVLPVIRSALLRSAAPADLALPSPPSPARRAGPGRQPVSPADLGSYLRSRGP